MRKELLIRPDRVHLEMKKRKKKSLRSQTPFSSLLLFQFRCKPQEICGKVLNELIEELRSRRPHRQCNVIRVACFMVETFTDWNEQMNRR